MSKKIITPNIPPPRKSVFGKFFFLLILIAIFLAIGSAQMRSRVIRLIRSQSATSQAAIYGRSFPLSLGTNIKDVNLADRLIRLGYQKTLDIPSNAGEFSPTDEAFYIFTHVSQVNENQKDESTLFKLTLSPKNVIQAITVPKIGQSREVVWIEPELLSLLSSEATRAVTRKQLSEFSPKLIDALLAIEDDRFYHHFGIDPIAIGRALYANIRAGHVVQGGSTITQQLVKNLFLDSDRTIVRKVTEIVYSVLVETAFTKKQILEFYLNEVFLGQEGNVAIHGFGEAARSFFGKDVSAITLGEAATLAGLVKAPSKYSPRRYPERAKERRNIVLGAMFEHGVITEAVYSQASQEKLSPRRAERDRRIAPYFVDFVRKSLPEMISESDMENPRLRVYTGIDLEYQLCAEKAVTQGLNKLEKNYRALSKKKEPIQGALIAVLPTTGEILAWVGGRDYGRNQYDRVNQAKRQPGSAFKPFVYLTALDEGLNSYRVARTTSTLMDEPVTLSIPGSDDWQPENYDREYRGEVSVREALTHSLNIPTVELAMKVGIERIAITAELFGFGANLPRVPSLALGAGEVSPLDMARAYTALANGGILLNLKPVMWISKDEESRPLFRVSSEEQRAAAEESVFVLTDILSDVINRGTANVIRRMGYDAPAAGKTGTSNDTRDAWFAGFTPHILGVVWVGFDNNDKHGLTGGVAAAPIWAEFMRCISPMEPKVDFIAPPGIVYRDVDRATGLLNAGYCPKSQVVKEVFVKGTEPVTSCPEHTPGVELEEETDIIPRGNQPKPRNDNSGFGSFLNNLIDRLGVN